jgi:hypothetical protein
MSSVNGKQVIAATMHSNIFYPGLGELKKELSSTPNGLSKPVKMTIDEPFLILEVDDARTKRLYTIPVPLTNFSHMVLAKEVVTTPPTKE